MAHVDGPDISADLTSQQLTHFLASVVTEWADPHRSIVSLSGSRLTTLELMSPRVRWPPEAGRADSA
jgi:hypothetical protein